MFFHIFLFQFISGFTSQNNQFTNHILATQVNTRIGFRVALFLCHFDGLAERNVRADFVKDVIQRTAQYRLYFQDLVSAVYQVIDRVDNRKSRTDIGFKQEFHTPAAGYLFQFTVNGVFGRSGNLVGSYDRNIIHQEIFI